MINVNREAAYYFPLDKKPRGNELTLELYSELSLSSIVFEHIGGEVVGDYFLTTIDGGMTEQVSNGEYNYTLYDNVDGEKVGIGLIRFDLEEGGKTDDEEYVVYQDGFDGYVQAIELTTTAFTENGVYEAQDKGWHEVTVNIDTDWYYTSGYTDGYESGMTDGKEIGYQSGYTNGYQSGFTDGVSSVPLTSITIDANGSYTAENGGYNSIVVNVPTGIIPEEYVTFTAQANNSSVGLLKLSTNQQLWYSTDTTNWNAMNTGTTVSLSSGDSVYVRGVLSNNNSSSNYTQFKMSGKIAASGNINYIWNYENPDAALKEYCGYSLFDGCTSLTTAPVLPATALTDSCYRAMFWECTSLTTAPALPATTLADYCYKGMFRYCSSLVNPPSMLVALTLGTECYYAMFGDCTSLTTTPTILTTTTAPSCFEFMFYKCSSLVNVPSVLPAMTLAEKCYKDMFCYCSSLNSSPILPATTMAEGCYQSMFYECTSLTTAPALPATTLANNCYQEMFHRCSSLVNVPSVLPATTLAPYCYYGTFCRCHSLVNAPELPATTMAEGCYSCMFQECTSLTTAPDLPAATLVTNCYDSLFYNSTRLNYIKCLATNISATDCTKTWVYNVANSGTFVKDPSMNDWTTGINGIPEGWTVLMDNVPESALS